MAGVDQSYKEKQHQEEDCTQCTQNHSHCGTQGMKRKKLSAVSQMVEFQCFVVNLSCCKLGFFFQ